MDVGHSATLSCCGHCENIGLIADMCKIDSFGVLRRVLGFLACEVEKILPEFSEIHLENRNHIQPVRISPDQLEAFEEKEAGTTAKV